MRKEGVKTRTDTDVLKLSDTTLAKFLRQDAELKNKVLEIIKVARFWNIYKLNNYLIINYNAAVLSEPS